MVQIAKFIKPWHSPLFCIWLYILYIIFFHFKVNEDITRLVMKKMPLSWSCTSCHNKLGAVVLLSQVRRHLLHSKLCQWGHFLRMRYAVILVASSVQCEMWWREYLVIIIFNVLACQLGDFCSLRRNIAGVAYSMAMDKLLLFFLCILMPIMPLICSSTACLRLGFFFSVQTTLRMVIAFRFWNSSRPACRSIPIRTSKRVVFYAQDVVHG